MATPDWDLWLASQWGPGFEGPGYPPAIVQLASNLAFGANPPYYVQDFLAMYPKFGGTPLSVETEATEESATVAIPAAGISVGNPVTDSAGLFPDGTVISSVGTSMVSLSNQATGSGPTTLTIWNATLIPLVVMLAYIALASSCLVQARWLDGWTVAMGLFVAHFLTLYAQSDGTPNSNIGMIAAQGLSTGITVAKAVGDVSRNYQAVEGITDWGAWNLTSYGQQFATMARLVGSGPLFLF